MVSLLCVGFAPFFCHPLQTKTSCLHPHSKADAVSPELNEAILGSSAALLSRIGGQSGLSETLGFLIGGWGKGGQNLRWVPRNTHLQPGQLGLWEG